MGKSSRGPISKLMWLGDAAVSVSPTEGSDLLAVSATEASSSLLLNNDGSNI